MIKRYIPEFDLTNKNILVTGAYGLIGKVICDAFASAGANFVISDVVKEEKLKKYAVNLSEKYSTKNIGLSIDITDLKSVASGVKRILKQFKNIDVLVNNAAIDAKFDENL